MNSRANILGRIRSALQKDSLRPEPASPGKLFPPMDARDMLDRFQREFLTLKGEFFRAANWMEAQGRVKQIADRYEFRRVAVMPSPEIVKATSAIQPRILGGHGDCGKALGDTDLGVSGCDCLVARTGSIVITPKTGLGRALSVLPPAHMVIASRDQLVADLSDAYALLQSRYSDRWPSMMTFITGPSRTSDIEKMLVLGAHGPKQLFLLLLDF